MSHSQKIGPSIERRLAMTFRMSQALSILQMPQMDLKQFIQEEIDKNPLLEEIKKGGSGPYDHEIADVSTVYENLCTQIRETFLDKEEYLIAEKIAGYLDEKGFLSIPFSELAQNIQKSEEEIDSIVAVLQTLEPPGIFARNLQESLLLQLKAKGAENTPIYALIQDDYQDLLHHRYGLLKKKYKSLDLSDAIQKIALLQLRPLEGLKNEISCPIIPDLFIRPTETGWSIGMCDEELPRFRLQYECLRSKSKEEQKTIDLWRSSGKWLIHALSRRREMILQIALHIARLQGPYLAQKGPLAPLTIQDLVSLLGVHESTISRALAEKYVETPRGIILLKSLITQSPKRKEAKEILLELVAEETTPLTDDQLAMVLKERGYPVARRTISKYRKELKIRSAQARRLYHDLP